MFYLSVYVIFVPRKPLGPLFVDHPNERYVKCFPPKRFAQLRGLFYTMAFARVDRCSVPGTHKFSRGICLPYILPS